MKISGLSPSTIRLSPELERATKSSSVAGAKEDSFGDLLKAKIDEVDQAQQVADKAVTDFSTGKSKNLHEAVLALEMADTSLRMMVTVRNKALEAYQEIMKMPI